MHPSQHNRRPLLTSGIIALAILAAIFSIPKSARADEGGVSFWVPGLFGFSAAAPLQPGWQFAAINYYDNVSASGTAAAAREITIGKLNPTINVNANVNLHAQADLAFLIPAYVFATPVFGGQFALSMLAVAGTNHVNVDGTITAGVRDFTVTRQGSIGDTATGVGDLYPMAALRWNSGVNNQPCLDSPEISGIHRRDIRTESMPISIGAHRSSCPSKCLSAWSGTSTISSRRTKAATQSSARSNPASSVSVHRSDIFFR
jgi:hypothetical protein